MTLILLAGVYFYALNEDILVKRISLGFVEYQNMHLYFIVYVTLIVGILWSLLIFFAQEIRLRIKLIQLKGVNKKLRNELNILRTQPLEDIDPSKFENEMETSGANTL